jgi:hypothetical protein
MLEAPLLTLALIIIGPRVAVPPDQVQARYEAQCVDGRWHASCPALRTELELLLLADLFELEGRGEIDRDTLRTAVRANFPLLAELGLRNFGSITSAEDRAAVLLAVEHPSPGVRGMARALLENQDDRWRKGLGVWWRASSSSGMRALTPDVLPEPELIGLGNVKNFEALRYRYFASDERRAVFTTKLTPEQVLALIAKGRKVVDGTKLAAEPQNQEALKQAMEKFQQEMQAAMARGDMRAMAELSQRMQAQVQPIMPTEETAGLKPIKEFSAAPAAVRYVGLPSRHPGYNHTAAAARDEAFGETVLVIEY